MSLRDVLGLPKRQFFWLQRQADRLEADADRRHLHILLAMASSEGVEQGLKALQQEVGVIYEWGKFIPPAINLTDDDGLDPEFDRAGLRALKAKHGA